MLDAQKKASLEYVGFWESALSKQASAESKANDASLAKLEANLEAKAAATKVFFEEQAAQYEIAQGSIGAGMLAGGGVRKAESGVEGELVEGAGIGGGAMIGGRALRGGITAIRGALTNSWNLMVGGIISILAHAGITASTIITGIPIIGAGIAGGLVNWSMRKQLQQMQGHYGTDKEADETRTNISKRLEKEIEKLKEAGKLTAEQVISFQEILLNGTLASFGFIERALKPLLPEGFATKFKTPAEQIKEADALADKYQKQLDNKKDEVTLEQNIADKNEAIAFLKQNINALDKTSVEYHEARARLLGDEVDLAADLAQQAEKLKAAGFIGAGSEWDKEQAEAGKRYMKNQIHAGEEESQYPTMEELAGRGFTQQLNKRYGKGGRFDLGRGGGMYSGIAQDYELAQKQQIWDREHGNIGQAEKDRQRMISDVTKLQEAGVANPTQLLGKIGDDVGKLSTLFHALIKQGAIPIEVPDNP
jgi:hypothetical protein